MSRHVETFEAISEDGERFTIHVKQEIAPAGSGDDPYATLPGLKSRHTAEGWTVNRKGEGVFEVLAPTGSVLVRRVDGE